MIPVVFNGMIAILMARFMLNAVPHALELLPAPTYNSLEEYRRAPEQYSRKALSATREAFSEVLRNPLVVAVVVYGSLGKTIHRLPGKQFRPDSDIDILVVIDNRAQVPLGYENIFHYVRENISPFIPEQILGHDADVFKVDDPDTALMFVDIHEDEMVLLKGDVETAKMHIKLWAE